MVICAMSRLSWVTPSRITLLVRACISENWLVEACSANITLWGFSKRKLRILMGGEGWVMDGQNK